MLLRQEFCSFFYALEIKKDYMEVGDSKAGVGLQDSEQKDVLSSGWLVYFKCVLT